jgi:ABC-type multidrug transport system fused ATPase/permease subunit
VVQFVTGASVTDRPVAYVPQQPWILNDTIRSNILFENKFDENRYNETVTACALDHDIAQLPAGHDTEIVSISGFAKNSPCRSFFFKN